MFCSLLLLLLPPQTAAVSAAAAADATTAPLTTASSTTVFASIPHVTFVTQVKTLCMMLFVLHLHDKLDFCVI